MQFEPMRKIRRDALTMYITEKLDGTNASIHIFEDIEDNNLMLMHMPYAPTVVVNGFRVYTASRKRWIAPNVTTTALLRGLRLMQKRSLSSVLVRTSVNGLVKVSRRTRI